MWMAITTVPWRDSDAPALLQMGAHITPALCWHEPGVLLLDLTASVRCLGGLRAIKQRVEFELDSLAMAAEVAMAATALGARLLLWQTPVRKRSVTWRYGLSPRRLAQRLDQLPASVLSSLRQAHTWLQALGCESLGQLRALPRQALAERTDPRLLLEIDQAYGAAVFQFKPAQLPAHFEQQRNLPYHIAHSPALAPYLQQLLEALCQWLFEHHLTATRLEWRLYHHDRRRARRPTILMMSVSQATDRYAVLWRWLKTRLDTVQLPAPVTQIVLRSHTLAQRQPETGRLFADPSTQQQQLQQTLDVLRARLGDHGVSQPACQPDHRPEVANQWKALSDTAANDLSTPVLGEHAPAWLLEKPRALRMHRNHPCLEGPLRLLHGPYRIETGWWQHQWALRDYFVATDGSTRRYWIYRQRDRVDARWFLHGLFG